MHDVQADVAIVNAAVFTADAARSWSDAVAVRGHRIIAVGGRDVSARIGPATDVIDAAGGLVLPGFQDAHVHAPFAGLDRLRIDLRSAADVQQCLDTVAVYARAHPDVEWICGGWALECFPGGTPTREDLDRVVPDRPVFLLNRDGHGAWVNSVALRRAGLDRTTPRDLYHPTEVKIVIDGVVENSTGALLEPYYGHGEGASSGLTHVAPDLLNRAVTRLDALDFQVHMHAIGDRAVRLALDAVQTARHANGHRGNRHHIAHVELVHPDDLPRFRQLNVVSELPGILGSTRPATGCAHHPADR